MYHTEFDFFFEQFFYDMDMLLFESGMDGLNLSKKNVQDSCVRRETEKPISMC